LGEAVWKVIEVWRDGGLPAPALRLDRTTPSVAQPCKLGPLRYANEPQTYMALASATATVRQVRCPRLRYSRRHGIRLSPTFGEKRYERAWKARGDDGGPPAPATNQTCMTAWPPGSTTCSIRDYVEWNLEQRSPSLSANTATRSCGSSQVAGKTIHPPWCEGSQRA
jgi:hypothetical protein